MSGVEIRVGPSPDPRAGAVCKGSDSYSPLEGKVIPCARILKVGCRPGRRLGSGAAGGGSSSSSSRGSLRPPPVRSHAARRRLRYSRSAALNACAAALPPPPVRPRRGATCPSRRPRASACAWLRCTRWCPTPRWASPPAPRETCPTTGRPRRCAVLRGCELGCRGLQDGGSHARRRDPAGLPGCAAPAPHPPPTHLPSASPTTLPPPALPGGQRQHGQLDLRHRGVGPQPGGLDHDRPGLRGARGDGGRPKRFLQV